VPTSNKLKIVGVEPIKGSNNNLKKGNITVQDIKSRWVNWVKCSCEASEFQIYLSEKGINPSRQVYIRCNKCKASIEINQLFKKWRKGRKNNVEK